MRYLRLLAPLLLTTSPLLGQDVAGVRDLAQTGEPDGSGVFLEAWSTVAEQFYDPGMHGVNWEGVRDQLLPRARAAVSPPERSAIINEAIDRLHASHTRHFAPDTRQYYELLDVFYPDGVDPRHQPRLARGRIEYVGIGLATLDMGGRTFVYDVYSGGPADKAGILTGDELIGVEGGPWGDITPFRKREQRSTRVRVQRSPDPASQVDLTVVPARIQPRDLFFSSIRDSARLVERDGRRIGYVRIRSYAHLTYHRALEACLRDQFAAADGLVLDLRGGWGGASPSYLGLFSARVPRLSFGDREMEDSTFEPLWTRPVAILIDGGSRSGKEVLAYGFKKYKAGILVGERTGGALLAGSCRVLSDGSLLYIAVSDVRVDGERLEGIGVAPDVEVRRALPYSEGADPQLEAAIDAVVRRCSSSTATTP